ncbi:MAG TPA: hypothetical protein VM452_02120 [Caulifigura sp.]|jgi:hypothetical protein|nr:hypothetical protein [Caulifigura sp.]
MFCDHPPDEKGPVVRQKFLLAISVVLRCRPAALSLVLTGAACSLPAPALAQQPAAGESDKTDVAEDANRKAANISFNPQTTYAEWKQLDKVRFIEFESKLKTAAPTEADKTLLLKHLKNQIYGLTIEQNVDRHSIIVDNIVRAAEQAGTSPAIRDYLLENTLKLITPLLKNQPPNVQYSLVLLAARLNVKPPKISPPPVPAQPYPASQQLLMTVLLDEQMPISARIIAARGLERLMKDGDISTVDKSRIGESLAMALKQKVDNPLARKWYRRRLVEALGVTGRYDETGYRPVIIDALMEVVTNPKDDWVVRSAAAKSVSQLPLDAKINVELVNYEIVRLLHDLTVAYNASDKTPPSTWRWAFDDLYLTYKSASALEQNTKHWGLMHLNTPRGKAQIEDAYKKVALPVLKPIVESQALPTLDAKVVTALAEWLKANNVTDRKVTPASGDLKDPGAAPPQAAAVGAAGTPMGN